MVIIVTLALFLLLFFSLRRNSGSALLAAIAGVAIYEMFGVGFAGQLCSWFPSWDLWWVEKIVYLILVLGFPLLLYFRSSRGGLHGILRLAQAVIFALILTALISGPLAAFFGFDNLSLDIANFIKSIQGYIVAGGAVLAYLDILFCRSSTD